MRDIHKYYPAALRPDKSFPAILTLLGRWRGSDARRRSYALWLRLVSEQAYSPTGCFGSGCLAPRTLVCMRGNDGQRTPLMMGALVLSFAGISAPGISAPGVRPTAAHGI